MAAEADANPHGFSRDVEVENAAVNLGIAPEQVKRMLISKVRETVARLIDENGSQLLPPVPEEAAEHRDEGATTPRAAAVPEPTPSQIDQHVLAPSEIQGLYRDTGGFMTPPCSSIRQVTAQVDVEANSAADMKGIEYLLAPVNVDQLIVQSSDGLVKMSEQINTVLVAASNFEASVREKVQIVAIHQGVLTKEDVDDINQSIDLDRRRLMLVNKWLTGIMHDLERLIRGRMQVQSQLMQIRGGNTVGLCKRIDEKTVKLRALYTFISTRADCLQIPASAAVVPAAAAQK